MMAASWVRLKTRHFDGPIVISSSQLPDKRWKYLRNAKTRQDARGAKEGVLAVSSLAVEDRCIMAQNREMRALPA
jgi:hypothetical protein